MDRAGRAPTPSAIGTSEGCLCALHLVSEAVRFTIPRMASPSTEPTTLHVCSFESRRAAEMQSLVERHGARATIAPSLREALLDDNPEAFDFAAALLAGRFDLVIFLTGVGARALLETICTRHSRSDILQALADCCVVVRGPKPVAVLREWQIRIDVRAPEPNTWREVIAALEDSRVSLRNSRVAVQEYGKPAAELHEALRERGAEVVSVPLYRWKLPADTGPLEDAVRRTIAGDFDVLMFTSAQQVVHVLEVAALLDVQDDWRAAANRCVIASIGPTASETLQNLGLAPDLEPSHPKMGHLVRETCEQAQRLLRQKRSSH